MEYLLIISKLSSKEKLLVFMTDTKNVHYLYMFTRPKLYFYVQTIDKQEHK